MEKKTIKCPQCHGILEITNPKSEPVLLITCPNPQCGAKMRVTFVTGETVFAGHERNDEKAGRLVFKGDSYPLMEGENTVGRQAKTSKATIQLPVDDQSVSREHLKIVVHRLKSGRVKAVVSDMRTSDKMKKKPTHIDDEPLMPEDAFVLSHGDTITLGNTKIKYVK